MAPLHWTPTRQDVEKSALNSFRQFVNKRYGLDFPETDFYWDLHAWSVKDAETINQFWEALWDWSGMIGEKGLSPVNAL
jgi:acetoacetyl-CoA synthetase